MKKETKLNYNIYSYAFNCFDDVILQIQTIQKEIECLFLDLEDAYEQTDPQARREALVRVERRFQETRKRRRSLCVVLEDKKNDLVPLTFLDPVQVPKGAKKELP